MRGGVTAVALTADLAARAIIAAAGAYGDHPVRACLAQKGPTRRCMTPAALAVANVIGVPFSRVAKVFRIRKQNASRAALRPGFAAALLAAERALRRSPPPAPAPEVAVVAPEIAVVAPEIAPGPRGVLPGRLAAGTRMPWIAPRDPLLNASPLGQRILEALGDDTGCTQGLATILDVKELAIAQALTALATEGLVEALEMPEAGRRQQRWRAVRTVAAA